MAAAKRMIDFSRKFFNVKMLNRIWTLSCGKRLRRIFAKKQEECLLIFRVLLSHTVGIQKIVPFLKKK